jgi:hypothetical protein
MMSKFKLQYGINIAYFAFVSFEIIAELFDFNKTTIFIRIVLPILLGTLYFLNTQKNNSLFYILLGFVMLSNILFFYRDSALFFYGILTFILTRIIALLIIFNLSKDKNYLHIIGVSFPFLLIFFYLISVTNEISNVELNVLILQSILISVLAGISITNYFKNENRQNSWLLISTLLFIGLRFIVFIERFIVSDLTLSVNRPIEVILTAFAFFTFYKYIIAAEINEITPN